MADKLKLSSEASNFLNILSTRLNLKRNQVCRIALSISLSSRIPVDMKINNNTDGYEFNKTTILGPDELLFRALSAFVQKEVMDEDFFNVVVRNHIEKGLYMMDNDFKLVNSPVSYLVSLLGSK